MKMDLFSINFPVLNQKQKNSNLIELLTVQNIISCTFYQLKLILSEIFYEINDFFYNYLLAIFNY